jgi:hypothetical protein
MGHHIIIRLSSYINIHTKSHVTNVYDVYLCHRNWVWVGLGGLKANL